MANERLNENIVKEHFRTDALLTKDEDGYSKASFEEQSSKNPKVTKVLAGVLNCSVKNRNKGVQSSVRLSKEEE